MSFQDWHVLPRMMPTTSYTDFLKADESSSAVAVYFFLALQMKDLASGGAKEWAFIFIREFYNNPPIISGKIF